MRNTIRFCGRSVITVSRVLDMKIISDCSVKNVYHILKQEKSIYLVFRVVRPGLMHHSSIKLGAYIYIYIYMLFRKLQCNIQV